MKLSMSLNYTGDPVKAAEEAADLEKQGSTQFHRVASPWASEHLARR